MKIVSFFLVLLVYFNVIPLSKIKALLGQKSNMVKSDQNLFMKLHSNTLSSSGRVYS